VDGPQILTLGATPEALAAWGIGGSVGHPLDPDRWAEDRQYERHDPTEALRAFARRGGIHQARGRKDLGEWVVSLAGHDDNRLGQLRRALERP
jgi:hypothetical protein